MVDISTNQQATKIFETFGKFRRQLNLSFHQVLKPVGLGPKQALLIRAVAKQSACSQAELSRLTITDPAAVGRAVESLVKKGWLEQHAHPSDRRRWEVVLSARGRQIAKQIEKIYGDLAVEVVGVLTPHERKLFLSLLEKLVGGLAGREEEIAS